MSFTAFGTCYTAALGLLPPTLNSKPAWAMLYAIALQESRLDARRQIGGPARGFHQWELGGITGVLEHHASGPLIRKVLDRLDYDYEPATSYAAVEHNDILDFAYARCLLWTEPYPIPDRDHSNVAWLQYLAAWVPGKPHRATWDDNYRTAWEIALRQ